MRIDCVSQLVGALFFFSVALAADTVTSTSNSTSTVTSLPRLSSSTANTTLLMPSLTTSMPKIQTSSNETVTSTSSFSQTFTPLVPTGMNPNVIYETLPSEFTFIIVGGILGLIALVLLITRIVQNYLSAKRAKVAAISTLQQDQYYNYDSSLFSKSKNLSSVSVYSVGSDSTQSSSGNPFPSSRGGRTYRNAISRASRSSLFISPTEMLSLPLPSFGSTFQENSGYSPIESPSSAYFDQTSNVPKEKRTRPPSVYMEELLNDDASSDFDGSDQYDYTEEKV